MTLVDVMNVPRLLDPQLSPDGRSLVYMLAQADWKSGRRALHIWRQDVGAPAPVQLTFGDSPETTARWSPDGKTILFLARRGDNTDTQVYLLPADGGEARQLTHHATSVSSPAWSPDGNHVYFVAADPKTAEEKARDHDKDDVYAFEENFKQRHLWRVVVSTGAEDRLTDGARLGPRLSGVAGRPPDRPRAFAVAARRRLVARRGLGDGRERPRRARPDAQQRRGERGGHLARRQPGAVPRRRQRAARAGLQHQSLRDAGGRRHAARGRRGLPVRRRSRQLGA